MHAQNHTLAHAHREIKTFALANQRKRSQVIENALHAPFSMTCYRNIDFYESMWPSQTFCLRNEEWKTSNVILLLRWFSDYLQSLWHLCCFILAEVCSEPISIRISWSIMNGVATFSMSGSWNDFSKRDIRFLRFSENDDFLFYICAQGNATNMVSCLEVSCQVIASFSRSLSLLEAWQGLGS